MYFRTGLHTAWGALFVVSCGHPQDIAREPSFVEEDSATTSLNLASAAEVFCPEGSQFLETYRLCGTSNEAIGPFPPAMVNTCISYGGGENACRSTRWNLSFAKSIRGKGQCPPGSTLDSTLQECIQGNDAYGPFALSTVKRCEDSGGGAACHSLRIAKSILALPAPVPPPSDLSAIEHIASNSMCARYSWKDRGVAPKGYVKGVALTFAKSVCHQTQSHVVLTSRPVTASTKSDALSWYNSRFESLGMSNESGGVDTLRHTYVLLLGLGMRESSGQYCCGRDSSASNTSAASAEAGAWQTSYDSVGASPELAKLFDSYRQGGQSCFLGTFKQGVGCSAADLKNWGSGNGYAFQKLEKECPAFAAEYAAVMMRVQGGSLGHYGPLRRKDAEINPDCDNMLQDVQDLIQEQPELCNAM